MYNYINNYTGELYRNLRHAIITIIRDIKFYPKCRTIKMLSVSRYREER